MLRSDCADEQDNLGLRCPHKQEHTFSHGTVHIFMCKATEYI